MSRWIRMDGRLVMQTIGVAYVPVRRIRIGVFAVLAVAFAGGCAHRAVPLAAVAPLPAPSVAPWIEQISPLGQADTLSQIRIIFKSPIVPVTSIESPATQSVLAKFSVEPALAGHFRLLTPRMVGFQADAAIPMATRVKVTLAAGLADLSGHTLTSDLSWTFNTQPVTLTNLPGTADDGSPQDEPTPSALNPVLKVRANTELDIESLRDHTTLSAKGGTSVPIDVERDTSTPGPDSGDGDTSDSTTAFDASQNSWNYTIAPRSDLAKGTHYSLKFLPGIAPANGNLPSTDTFVGQVVTYSPLALQKTEITGEPNAEGPAGRFVNGIIQLDFNNPLDAASANTNVTVQPAPSDPKSLVYAYDGDNTIGINPAVLSPDTAYTITIHAGLKDQFGQTLDKDVTAHYRSGDLAGDIWAAQDFHIFPIGTGLRLDIATVNLPKSGFRAAYRALTPDDLVWFDPSGSNVSTILPDDSAWSTVPVTGQRNQLVTTSVPIEDRLGSKSGVLAYGIEADTNQYHDDGGTKWRTRQMLGVVQLTDLGVFAQFFPAQAIVRVNHLSDGAPASGATVQIYRSYSSYDSTIGSLTSPCAVGATDATGVARFGSAAIAECMSGYVSTNTDTDQAPDLLTVVRTNTDWSYVRTLSYDGAWQDGLDGDWGQGRPQSRGAIYTDRQLYQPGETVKIATAAFALAGGQLKRETGAQFRVALDDPNGNHSLVGTATADSFGSFSQSLTLAQNQPLGYYALTATGDDGVTITGGFRVARFRAPNFKVALTLDKSYAQAGSTVNATGMSTYLFGAPVQGGKTQVFVTRAQMSPAPKGWDAYSFGPQWFWPDQPPTVTSDVLQANGTVDQSGASSQAVSVAADLPYPMSYRVDLQTTDISNLSVADSQSFTALPSLSLIGLSNDWVATAGKPFSVHVVVVDPDGKPLAGKAVHLDLQSMKYIWAGQIVEGGEAPQDRVIYSSVASTDVTSSDSDQTVSLTAPASGSYRIRANLGGATSEATASDSIIYVAGDEPYSWGSENQSGLNVKLDKKTYKIGDTATALIESPYPRGQLYFAVVRRGVITSQMLQVSGSAPRVSFRVTPDMLPNAAVEAVLVRQGAALASLASGSLDSLARAGFAPFETDVSAHHLNLKLRLGSATVQPGQEQSVALSLLDADGKPASGEFAVMVVNEAILQLTGYRPPDLLKTVFADQPISTRFSDNRADVVLSKQKLAGEKGWGYGGGLSSGAAGTRVRTNFQPIAYFNGAVRTDAAGHARISFTLPDDLTTWRVMAVAIGAPGSAGAPDPLTFGSGDTTFIANKPLVTNALLPQFARPGDDFQGGVSITNSTGAVAQATTTLALTGPLALVGSSATQTVSVPTGTSAFRSEMRITGLGTSTVRYDTRLGASSDAFSVPLDIVGNAVMESTADTGSTQSRATVPIEVGTDVARDAGGLDVTLASSLVPLVAGTAADAGDFDDLLPFAEPAASRLRMVADIAVIEKKYDQSILNVAVTGQAILAINELKALQQSNGGIAECPCGSRAAPLVSAYAGSALGRARDAGLAVDAALVRGLTGYLQLNLANPYDDYCKSDACAAELRFADLQALAALGDRRTDFLPMIYANRDQLGDATRLALARYLSQTPGWDSQATAMSDAFEKNVYITARGAAIGLAPESQWYDSQTSVQALMLRLLVVRSAPTDLQDNALRSLLGMRRNGSWGDTFNDAEALDAIVDYGAAQDPAPAFTAIAALGGANIASETFNGYVRPLRSAHVPMATIPAGKSELSLSVTGTGTLHYTVAYQYRPSEGQPGVLAGLRVLREVRAANQDQVLASIGLSVPAQPISLPAANVFDVGLQIITDHFVDHVVIEDPLPAGFEAVDASFATSTPYFQAKGDPWQIDYQVIDRDKIRAFATTLPPGIYDIHYLVRTVTPGTFVWPGARAYLLYSPEEFGRTASAQLVVTTR
ncbi:MAG TPA: Ig-like domain-containing protein [Candidatus Eremiobacteraceae bacterium]|nr:Ig-like domain-containing protein [Candidatus Eremiobacteraceae bacterium]